MKKLSVMILLVVLMVLTGCVGHTDAESPAEERIKISVAIWDAEDAFKGDPVLDAIEEKFGVTFEPVNVTWDDHYQKIERLAATDSLPDLFAGDFRKSSQYLQWIENGLLCPIPEDLSGYPHLESYMDELKKSQITAVNDHIYCIPRQTYPTQAWTSVDRVIAYRWDLAQKAGISKEPETWEEFQEMIQAIIKADPEHTSIQGMTTGDATLLSCILLQYASPTAVSNGNGFYWKLDADGIYKPVYFADDLTSAFQLGRDMYQSGVIEADVLLETSVSAYEKFLRGESAAILYSGGFGGTYKDMASYWDKYHGRAYTEDVKALKLMPDVNGTKAYPIWGYAWSESYISAKVDEEKRDKILQIYDYLLSDEGAFFGTYGPEGDLYEIVDGKVRMNDENTYVQDKYPSCGVFTVLVRWLPSTYDDRFVSDLPETYNQVSNELMKEAESVPIPEYEPQCSIIMKEEKIDFSINVGEDFLRIMLGTEPVEQIWEEIKQEYEEKGLQEMIETINAKMGK